VCKKQKREIWDCSSLISWEIPVCIVSWNFSSVQHLQSLLSSKFDSLVWVACTSLISHSTTKGIRILCGWLLGSTISRLQISASFATYIPHPSPTKQPRMCNPRLVFAWFITLCIPTTGTTVEHDSALTWKLHELRLVSEVRSSCYPHICF
jgi:hypothetical protein